MLDNEKRKSSCLVSNGSEPDDLVFSNEKRFKPMGAVDVEMDGGIQNYALE